VILRERVVVPELILDDAILEGWSVYRNGCSFSLEVRDRRYFLKLGCYVLVNLIRGAEKILFNYIESNSGEVELIPNENVKKETILALLSKTDNCTHCGGVVFNHLEQLTKGILL